MKHNVFQHEISSVRVLITFDSQIHVHWRKFRYHSQNLGIDITMYLLLDYAYVHWDDCSSTERDFALFEHLIVAYCRKCVLKVGEGDENFIPYCKLKIKGHPSHLKGGLTEFCIVSFQVIIMNSSIFNRIFFFIIQKPVDAFLSSTPCAGAPLVRPLWHRQ